MIRLWRQPEAAETPDLSTPESGAAYWDARLRSPTCTDDERAAFAQWRDADAAHAAAFEQLQLVVHELRGARHRPELRAMRDAALGRTRQSRMKWLARAAVLAALACSVGLVAYWIERGDLSALAFLARGHTSASFATAVGERSTVTLDDGSMVTLNTQSRVTVDYGGLQRRVYLLNGQALFEVAKDPRRPFVVYADDQRITALGTAFDVWIGADDVKVTIVEGRVTVDTAPPDAASSSPSARALVRTELAPGEQLVAVAGSAKPEVRQAKVDLVTSWREGIAEFQDSPLSEAVAEINRYSTTQIVLADEAMGELRVNGRFRTGQVTSFVNAMQDYFAIDARPAEEDKIRLEWRR